VGSQSSPWNSLATVSARGFNPGDSILLRCGTVSRGALVFQSSGTSSQPIVIGAYDTGSRPVIDGTGNDAALELNNTSYVTVQGLEIKNGRTYGVLATTSLAGVVNGLTLKDLIVHDVTGGAMTQKFTGLVVVTPGTKASTFNNVLIDGVQAYNTTLWSGIMVYGTYLTGDHRWQATAQNVSNRSTNIVIRNSIAHDTYGDGIVVYLGSGVLMERNLVYRSGMQPNQTIGTPNALWSWASNDVVVQDNEAYDNHSPGVDGGGFDIDYWSANTTVQYNYAHDNQGYGIGVFGAESAATNNSIVRYNVFANNGTKNFGDGAEEIYFATWDRGTLNGVQIYNNTIYTTNGRGAVGTMGNGNPAFSSSSPLFKNNLVISTAANTLGTGMTHIPFQRDCNLYFSTVANLSGTEAHSLYNSDPRVNGLGYHGVAWPVTEWTLDAGSPAINRAVVIPGAPSTDFFGQPSMLGAAPDIGASESR
jgi:Right handed beta helix region